MHVAELQLEPLRPCYVESTMLTHPLLIDTTPTVVCCLLLAPNERLVKTFQSAGHEELESHWRRTLHFVGAVRIGQLPQACYWLPLARQLT